MRHLPLWPLLALACAGEGTPVGPTAEPEPVPVEPAPFQRLTAPQLRNTLVDLLGPVPFAELQPDDSPNLFRSIGAATTPYSELGVDRVETAVAASTALVFFDPDRRLAVVGCEPVSPGDTCVRSFLADFGLRAYRRPLTATELDLWTWVARTWRKAIRGRVWKVR